MAVGRALYRKYRPTILNDVVGQQQVTEPLANSIKNEKINHAYLFIGPRGTGKTSVARILAHAVNKFTYQAEDSHLDIIEIDAASNTGVDNIRELREKAIIAPVYGKYKVYIIDEVHMLSKSAANALLKTLEEPPKHVIFILATTEANKVPITISSRTQTFTFQLANPELMLDHIRKISSTEKISITDSALKIIVRRGGGSFRDTLNLLDQISSLTDEEITESMVNNALGLPTNESINALIDAYANGDTQLIQRGFQDLLNCGIHAETIAAELIQSIISSPTPSTLPLLEKLPQVQPPFPEAKLLLALLSKQSITQPVTQPEIQKNHTKTNLEQPQPTPKIPSIETELDAPSITNTTTSTKELPQDASAPISSAPQQNTNFSWESLLNSIRTKNQAVYIQLQKTEHELKDDTLHIYPLQKFTTKILKKPENSQIISSELQGLGLVVHDLEDRHQPEDSTLSQISAIMGDVREVNGEMPF